MNRRSFLKALIAVPLAAVALPAVPESPTLTIHPDVFASVMAGMPPRYDILYGYAVIRPNYAVRIASS